MFIPFLPKTEVEIVLEDEARSEESMGEMLAEYGSSAFYSGFSSGDASLLAQDFLAERRADFDASEDAPLYYARLEAARFFADAITQDMRVWELEDDEPIWGKTVIPEFFPGERRTVAFSDLDLSDLNDIPF